MATMTDPFTVKASSDTGGDFERPDPGIYPARLIAVVDMGTHTRVFGGKATTNRKLFLTWELCGEADSQGNYYLVGQDFSLSLHPKANYRKLVEAWIGRTMTDGQEFNITEMVDKPCCVTISEGISGSGTKFTEISSVGPVMRGLNVPQRQRDPFIFTVNSLHSSGDTIDIPDWMPRTYGKPLAEKIRESAEFGNLPGF